MALTADKVAVRGEPGPARSTLHSARRAGIKSDYPAAVHGRARLRLPRVPIDHLEGRRQAATTRRAGICAARTLPEGSAGERSEERRVGEERRSRWSPDH